MWAIFKPLFIFKKYKLADEVLKQSCGSFVWVTNSDNEEPYLSEKNFGQTYLAVFILQNKDLDTVRLMESIELLEKNGHIISHKNPNLYKYSIEPTKSGERALNDGYYMKTIYKWMAIIIGSPIVLFLLSLLLKVIK